MVENPWCKIPLEDYELHMQHDIVGQAQLLNNLTRKYLVKHHPEHILFLGISGGNGLANINTDKVKSIVGIDINQAYIAETEKRFGNKLKQLRLLNLDINTAEESLTKANLVWGALIIEYVDIDRCFKFISNNTAADAKLIFTIQSNNGIESISQTGIESLNAIEELFKVVEADDLISQAANNGFRLNDREENILPNGKSFITIEFVKH